MRKLLLIIVIAAVAGILSRQPPAALAQSNTWFEIAADWEYDVNRAGCSTFSTGVADFEFTNPPNATLHAIRYTFEAEAGPGVQHRFLGGGSNIFVAPSGAVSSTGSPVQICVGRFISGVTTGCTELGYTSFMVNGSFHSTLIDENETWTTGQVELQVACGQTDADAMFSNAWMIYFGIEPTQAYFEFDPPGGSAPVQIEFTDLSTGPIVTWSWYIDDGDIITNYGGGDENHNLTHLFTEPGSYEVTLLVNEGMTNESEFSDTVVITEPEDLVRPFTAADEGVGPNGEQADAPILTGLSFVDSTSFQNVENSAIAFSKGQALVHAAKTGTIFSIVPLKAGNCKQDADHCYITFTPDHANLVGAKTFQFMLSNTSIVSVQTAPGVFFRYLVTNPTVSVGATVSAGCPLGESVPIELRYTNSISEFLGLNFNFLWERIAAGLNQEPEDILEFMSGLGVFRPAIESHFTVVQQIISADTSLSVYPVISELVEYPEDEPRTCDYQPSGCLSADPELKRPEVWTQTGVVEFWTGGGAVLNPGASISMQLSLDSEVVYTVDVWSRVLAPGIGNFSVQLGQTQTSFTTGETFNKAFTTPGTPQPDLGTFHTFRIANTGSLPIFIQSACVRDENNTDIRPGTCYFYNYNFKGFPHYQGWTISEGVTEDPFIPSIRMADDSTISQNVQLYPDGVTSHFYDIYIISSVRGAPHDELASDFDSEISFQWEYPASAGFEDFVSPNTSAEYEVGAFFTTPNGINILPDYEIKFTATIEVTEFTNSVLTIKAIVDSTNEAIVAQVRQVCINDSFAHHGDTGLPPLPLPINCNTVPAPEGSEDFGPWIYYHWANLSRFFTCDLMVLLNRMNDTIQRAWLLFGWQFRYFKGVVLMASDWLSSDLIHWLNGHFRNMAIGQVTTITEQPGASLWDVLLALIESVLGPIVQAVYEIIQTLLWLIEQVATLVFAIITAAISFVLALITQVINLMSLGQALLASIVTSFNTATPTALPGMPDCSSDPQSHHWCISLWIMENTIFSGSGAAIIPLLTGILGIHLILWVVGEIKRAIMQTGQAT